MRVAAVASTCLAVLTAPYFILGPWIDNRLPILTRRDLRLFRAQLIAGVPLEQVITSRAGPVRWRAEHDEVIWASEIEATTDAGETYRWELSHAAPRSWLPPQPLYITPLNLAAVRLVPELVPSELRDLRLIPLSPYGSGIIYDMAHPDKALECYGPWLRANLPQLFNDERSTSATTAGRGRRENTSGPTRG